MVVKCVEGVEERFLSRIFSLKKLDVIDQENVDFSIPRLKLWAAVVCDGVDEVVGEFFGTHVADTDSLVQAAGVMTNGVEQVCFP